MKQIMTEFIRISILIIVWSMSVITISAEEVIIESIYDKNNNSWDNRSLIQTTSHADEYVGAVKLGAFTMPELTDKNQNEIFEEASKCIVRIEMGQYVGSGLIWNMEENGMVLAANKHLLRESAYGMVTFVNEMVLQAKVLHFSQECDLGFLFIPREQLYTELLRECYEVRKVPNEVEQTDELFAEKKIIQIASSERVASDCYKGTVRRMVFVPEFQTYMLETMCFSEAGMSGGGVFDEKGNCLGMIAGGEVGMNDLERKSEITYSIPVWQIENEYRKIKCIGN